MPRFGILLAVTCAQGEVFALELAPKILARMTTGFVGNFGIGWEKPIARNFSFGLDYRIESDSGTIIRGLDIFARYYFLSPGTRIEQWSSQSDGIVSHAEWSPYVGLEGMSRDYGVRRSAATQTSITGSLAGMNGLVGVNYRISRRLEASAEAAMRVFTSFQTDTQIEQQSLIFIFTLGYLY
jgi:hypothetical protein